MTLKDYYSNPLETTKETVSFTDTELTIRSESVLEGFVLFSLKITFTLHNVGDIAGTCFPSKATFESPMSFQSLSMSCRNPYNDSYNYGQVLSILESSLPVFTNYKIQVERIY